MLERERDKYSLKLAALICGMPWVSAHGNMQITEKRFRKKTISSGGIDDATCLVMVAITDEKKQEQSIHKMLFASIVLF